MIMMELALVIVISFIMMFGGTYFDYSSTKSLHESGIPAALEIGEVTRKDLIAGTPQRMLRRNVPIIALIAIVDGLRGLYMYSILGLPIFPALGILFSIYMLMNAASNWRNLSMLHRLGLENYMAYHKELLDIMRGKNLKEQLVLYIRSNINNFVRALIWITTAIFALLAFIENQTLVVRFYYGSLFGSIALTLVIAVAIVDVMSFFSNLQYTVKLAGEPQQTLNLSEPLE